MNIIGRFCRRTFVPVIIPVMAQTSTFQQPAGGLFFSSIGILFFLLFNACQNDKPAGSSGTSGDVAPPADALFQKVPSAESNIRFANNFKEDFYNNIIRNPNFYNGGGVGIIDVNKDGKPDIFFTSTTGACKLYLNEGGMKFRDITKMAGVAAEKGFKSGVTIADVNGDGWPDIYLCRTGLQPGDDRRNLLFINNWNNTFSESAADYGVDDPSPSNHANFFDYDNDGDLDLYVLNFPADFDLAHRMDLEKLPSGKITRNTKPHTEFDSDRLYRNNGFTPAPPGTTPAPSAPAGKPFTDISKQAGIDNRAFGLSSLALDWNGDHYPDILVANDYLEPDFFYINNRNGAFTDQTHKSFRHISAHTMGTDAADINGDGLPDLLALDMLAEEYPRQKRLTTVMLNQRYKMLVGYGYWPQMMRNVLQLNNGPAPGASRDPGGMPSFSEIGCLAGIFQTDWSWSVLSQDYDLDGWPDIFITNGYPRDVTDLDYVQFTDDSIQRNFGGVSPEQFKTIDDYLNLIPSNPQRNYMYRNRGDLTFENKTIDWGFTDKTFSNGAAYADLDNDGDLDLVVNNAGSEALLYRNTAADRKKGAWLELHFEGPPGNIAAFHTVARVTAGNRSWQQELTPVRGFYSCQQPMLHFGLGDAGKIDKIEVLFPPGNKLLVLENQAVNQRLTLNIKDAKPGSLTTLPPAQTNFFQEITGPEKPDFTHREDEYEDFDHERLLPWRMSTPGPRIASGDVNGDRLDDFYIGGAANSAGALFVQTADGRFARSAQKTWDADAAAEDTGATFFDADGDSDLDLFVAGGGNSAPAGDARYQPRLYLNDSRGNFTRAAQALPVITDSGSAVATFDYDNDGDLDVFLGGWCVPGAYPVTPGSYVLRNDKGTFSNVTAQVAPGFAKCGMVRAIAFADLNGDQKAEILVAGEWMPLTVFQFKNGKFEDVTTAFGLDQTHGYWRSLAAADFDGDGDIDFIAGNLGLNSRLMASREAPLTIYAKDFDNNGSIDPLMCYTKNGTEYPLALREVLLKQLPPLKKKFVRNAPYADATLEDVYPRNELKTAQRFIATELRSAYFENQGGKFVLKPLPNLAQAAPANAIIVLDVNKDGKQDIVLAGNDYGQQVETGAIDAGNGLVLLNEGKGSFKPVPGCLSGLWADKDARSLALVRAAQQKMLLLVGNSNDKMQVFELRQ
jgi:hypothetical protein